jgi:RNA polymerase sigma factor FliA
MRESAGAKLGRCSVFEAQRLAAAGEGFTTEQLRAYLPLVRVALERLGSYLPLDVEREALAGRAILALVEAAEKKGRETPGFEDYARLRIWRALTDCLRRSRCFMISTQAAVQRLSEATGQALRVGLEGGEDELSALLSQPLEELRTDLAQVAALMVAAPQSVVALQQNGDQLEARLAQAVCELPQREQLIVAMYYFEDLTFAEIARVLELSEPEVEWAFGRAALLLRVHLHQHLG